MLATTGTTLNVLFAPCRAADAVIKKRLETLTPQLRVTQVPSLEELQTTLTAHAFDVVLAEIGALGTDDVDIIDHVRSHWPSAPVVLLGSATNAATVAEAFRRGAADWIVPVPDQIKRFTEALHECLRRWHHRFQANRQKCMVDEVCLKQSHLAHAQRTNMVGELAAGLAHELCQPLGAIQNYASFLNSMAQDLSQDCRALGAVVQGLMDEAGRAKEFVRNLRRFLLKGEPQQSPHDINQIIEDAVAFISAEVRRSQARVNLDLMQSLPEVQVDSVQIGQVVVNLIKNAIEAMQEQPLKRSQVLVRTRDVRDREQIEVSVTDTGPGVPASIRQRVFDSYFTTKPNGMGVGLRISHLIVEAHGGTLALRTNSRGGATFSVCLPYGSN